MTTKAPILPVSAGSICLRRLSPADLSAFQAYRRDPEVARYQSWSAMTDVQATAFLTAVQAAPLFVPGEWCQIAVADAARGDLIGDIGICVSDDSDTAEIGISLARGVQGQGLGRTALRLAVSVIFDRTAVAQVLGITDARNIASQRALAAAGFDMIRTQEVTFRGAACTEHVFAISRPDRPGDALRG